MKHELRLPRFHPDHAWTKGTVPSGGYLACPELVSSRRAQHPLRQHIGIVRSKRGSLPTHNLSPRIGARHLFIPNYVAEMQTSETNPDYFLGHSQSETAR